MPIRAVQSMRLAVCRRKSTATLAIAAFAIMATLRLQAQNQTVANEVQAVNQLSFRGSPSLASSSATAGSAPTSVTSSVSYAVTTNESDRKITAQLDQAAPIGVVLSANLAAPSGAASVGAVALTASAQDLVTAISTLSGRSLAFTLASAAAAGVVASTTRVITYTIIAGT